MINYGNQSKKKENLVTKEISILLLNVNNKKDSLL